MLRHLASAAILRILLLGALAMPSPADWRISNKTPEEVNVSIVFDDGEGYISTGSYRLAPCGGPAAVYHGMPKLRGVFFHAESVDGRMKWGDSFAFCVSPGKFRLSGPTVIDFTGQTSWGLRMENFHLEKLTGNNFTSNLTGKDGSGQVALIKAPEPR
jgi:uncharacterized membrane protein